MTDYVDAAKRLHGFHGKIAADVWPKGSKLTCDKCKRSQTITTAQCALYLRQGWPMCCGLIMSMK